MTYTCTTCKEIRDIGKFKIDPRYRFGHKNTCNICTTKTVLNSQRKRKYGMCADEYQKFFELHGNMCDVCGSSNKLGVDHCHTTGIVRGLLCSKCNTALGLLDDDKKKLVALLAYIEQHASLSYS